MAATASVCVTPEDRGDGGLWARGTPADRGLVGGGAGLPWRTGGGGHSVTTNRNEWERSFVIFFRYENWRLDVGRERIEYEMNRPEKNGSLGSQQTELTKPPPH